MKNSDVVVALKCSSYKQNEVDSCVKRIFELLGGAENLIKPGMKILIKPNLLKPKEPSGAVTTNPAVILSVANICVSLGASVIIADSPGGDYSPDFLKKVYDTCKISDVAQKSGAKLNFDTSFEMKTSEKGVVVKEFPIIKPICDADLIINIAKLKTHVYTGMSAAVKNLYGTIPGHTKRLLHIKYPERQKFASMLVDLCLCVSPQISIVDGIWGMEGNGPAGGTPRQANVILAANNPFWLDLAAATVIGFSNPFKIFTVNESFKRKLIPDDYKKLNFAGDNLDSLIIHDYKKPLSSGASITQLFPEKIRKFLDDLKNPYPYMPKEACIGCGECAKNCPADIIKIVNQQAVVDYSRCIKCYCCHELCPVKAVELKKIVFKRGAKNE